MSAFEGARVGLNERRGRFSSNRPRSEGCDESDGRYMGTYQR
jgi:hypothetical protein